MIDDDAVLEEKKIKEGLEPGFFLAELEKDKITICLLGLQTHHLSYATDERGENFTPFTIHESYSCLFSSELYYVQGGLYTLVNVLMGLQLSSRIVP